MASKNKHIHSFQALLTSLSPGPRRVEAVDTCLGHVHLLVSQILGECSIVVQGSYAQGLALCSSDVDLAIVTGNSRCARGQRRECDDDDAVDRRLMMATLRSLADALDELHSEEIRVALRVFSARMPVLRLRFVTGSEDVLGVDVSVAGSAARGACDRYVHRLLGRDASGSAAAFCRLIKHWAKRKQLTNTLRGGLSSFCFVLLAVFFLQTLPPGRADLIKHRLPTHRDLSVRSLRTTRSGCPAQLVAPVAVETLPVLLEAFFQWASQELPQCSSVALSVVTGQAGLRLRSKGSFRAPLQLDVPFGVATDNAARCLRRDVWENLIVPELARGRSLVQRLLSGGDGAAAQRDLFSPSGKVQLPPELRVVGSDTVPPHDSQENTRSKAPCVSDDRVSPRKKHARRSPKEVMNRPPKRRRVRTEPKSDGAAASGVSVPFPQPTPEMHDRWTRLRTMLSGT